MDLPPNNGMPTQQRQNEVDLSAMMGMDMDMDLSLEGTDASNSGGGYGGYGSTTSEAGAYPLAQEMMTGAGAGPL